MKYEIVEIKEKIVAGINGKTGNHDKDMLMIIGGLWQRFYETGIYASIHNKVDNKSIGLYSEYEDDINESYDIMVCCEVDKEENMPADIIIKKIPAGRYAKFIVHGHVQKAVAEFWTALWGMDLDRAYLCDFEEYQGGEDMENMEIHMYISLK